ncbi:hypothetical protein HDV00_007688 [Rhizophlyctis rosea]|nr:hypothetical protein HDV00_007688 [Rhizophlyctis rosea]
METYEGKGFLIDYPTDLSPSIVSTFPKYDKLLNNPKTWANVTVVPEPKDTLFSKPFRILFIHPDQFNNTVRQQQSTLENAYRAKNEKLPKALSYLVKDQAGWYDVRVNKDRIHINMTYLEQYEKSNQSILPLYTCAVILHELSHLLVARAGARSPEDPQAPERREAGIFVEHQLFGGSIWFEGSNGKKVEVLEVRGKSEAGPSYLSQDDISLMWDVLNGIQHFPIDLPIAAHSSSISWESEEEFKCKYFAQEDDAGDQGSETITLATLVRVPRPDDKKGTKNFQECTAKSTLYLITSSN